MDDKYSDFVYTMRTILIVIGTTLIEIYYASPGIMLYKYNKEKIPEKMIPTLQILTNLFNTITWIISGIKANASGQSFTVDETQKIVCNSIGTAIGVVLTFFLWLVYSKNKKSEHLIYLFMIYNVFIQIFYIIFRINCPMLSKSMSIILNIIMYSTPLIYSYYAYRCNNRKIIPIVNVAFGTSAAAVWACYALFGYFGQKEPKFQDWEDWDSLVANSLSLLVLIPNIVLYFKVDKKEGDVISIDALLINEEDKSKESEL